MFPPSSKKPFPSHPVLQLVGGVCFFLVIPFGIIFGVLHRLLSGSHHNNDRIP